MWIWTGRSRSTWNMKFDIDKERHAILGVTPEQIVQTPDRRCPKEQSQFIGRKMLSNQIGLILAMDEKEKSTNFRTLPKE